MCVAPVRWSTYSQQMSPLEVQSTEKMEVEMERIEEGRKNERKQKKKKMT